MYFIDHKQPIYIQDNPKSNRKEYEVNIKFPNSIYIQLSFFQTSL